MKGDLLDFNAVKNLEDKSRVWVIWRQHSSDIYSVEKEDYGINFVKYYSSHDWLSFSMTYTALEYSIKNNLAKVYRWVTNEEYLDSKLSIIKNAIDISLDTNNKNDFIKLAKEYSGLLKEKELLINEN